MRTLRPRELSYSNAFTFSTKTPPSLSRLPITISLLLLYWNMILCQDLKISIKLLDSFHHYLTSKHLEFIKFISFCCYLLLLEYIIISSSFFFFMALEDLEFAILVLVTLTASLLPNFKNMPHHSKEMKPFSFQNWIDWFPQWKVRVKDSYSSM